MATTNKRKNFNSSQKTQRKKVKNPAHESNRSSKIIINEINPLTISADVGATSSFHVVNTQTRESLERISERLSPVLDQDESKLNNSLSTTLGNEFYNIYTQINQVVHSGADLEDCKAYNTPLIPSKLPLNNVKFIRPTSLAINSTNVDRDLSEILSYKNDPNHNKELLGLSPVLDSSMYNLMNGVNPNNARILMQDPINTKMNSLGCVEESDSLKSPVLDSSQYRLINRRPTKALVKETLSKLKSDSRKREVLGDNSSNKFEGNVPKEKNIATESHLKYAGFIINGTATQTADTAGDNKFDTALNLIPTFTHSPLIENKPLSPILDSSQCRSMFSSTILPCADNKSKECVNCNKQSVDVFKDINTLCIKHNTLVPQEQSYETRSDHKSSITDFLLTNENEPLSPILDSSECKVEFMFESFNRTSPKTPLLVNNTNSNVLSIKNNKSSHRVSTDESPLNKNHRNEPVTGLNQNDLQPSTFSLGIFHLSPELTNSSCNLQLDQSRPSLSIRNITSNDMPMASSILSPKKPHRVEMCEDFCSSSINIKSSKDELNPHVKTNKSILANSPFESNILKAKANVPSSPFQLSGEHKSSFSTNRSKFVSNDLLTSIESKVDEAIGGESALKKDEFSVSFNIASQEECSTSDISAISLNTVKRKLDFDHLQITPNLTTNSLADGPCLKKVEIENIKCDQDRGIEFFITSPQREEHVVEPVGAVNRNGNSFRRIVHKRITPSPNPTTEMRGNTHEIIIEEFDEDSPSKVELDTSFEESQIITVEEILNPCFHSMDHQFHSPNLKNNVNNQDAMNSDLSSFDSLERLDLAATIEEDLSQQSLKSDVYKIECSTSPLTKTKSNEGTQNENSVEIASFPPALDVVTSDSKPIDVLDSACKTRKSKVKKGSLSERLKRVLRAEKAEVNMFHHEAPVRQGGVCLLRVNGTTKVASRLVLSCRYACKSGPNCIDPEVQLLIDPDLNKKITVSSHILLFPPWKSLWLDYRKVLLLFGVSKFQLNSEISSTPSSILSHHQSPLLQSYSCTSQTAAECGCQRELMTQLFGVPQGSQSSSPAEHSVVAALSTPRPPDQVTLKFNVLHRFSTRCKNEVVRSLICVDGDNCIFQFNLSTLHDGKEVDLLFGESNSNAFLVNNITLCNHILIDRCEGLRSMLSLLSNDVTNQQLMYICSPLSLQCSVTLHSTHLPRPEQTSRLLSLAETESVDGEIRVECEVQVIALRANQLYVWDQKTDAYFKIRLDPVAVMPNYVVRENIRIRYLRSHQGILTIDQYSTVTVKESVGEPSCSPPIPVLALDSQPGDLVFLDAVVSRLSSEVQLRWEGACGHALVRVAQPPVFICHSCCKPTDSRRQTITMEVCAVVSDLRSPVRVKVKSETAQLLFDIPGELTSNKKYNMIRAIGASLKCLAVVIEVLKNPFGDILEFYVEEL